MKFRPCIDIHKGKVKQIVGGTLTDNSKGLVENFVSDRDAAYYAKMYERDALTGGHVIMLGSGNEDEAVRALRAYPQGLQLGGGVTADNAEHYLEAGASHVIVTSYVFKDGHISFDNLNTLIQRVGVERVVLDVSCRAREGRYYVVTDKWQKFTDFELTAKNLNMLANSCAEFLIHAADVEGKCSGIEVPLAEKLGRWVARSTVTRPVTYAGGIRSLEDITLIGKMGNGKLDFTVGSALDIFGGTLSYADVVRWKS